MFTGVEPTAEPLLRRALDAWLAEAEGAAPPPERNPWTRPGWFAQAEAWIQAQLAAQGRVPTGPVEQVKSWSISCVLRVPTATNTGPAGAVYFKAVPPLFGAEPVITRALAQRFPKYVPPVLAADAPRRWLLLEDVGPPLRGDEQPLSGVPDVALWERVVRAIGRIQRAYAAPPDGARSPSPTDALLAMGCADRRLHILAGQIDLLLDEASDLDQKATEPAAQLRRLTSPLRDLCAQLAAAEVPQALVHGDLHAGNVALRDGEPVYFDWTDACVAHPFQDYVTLISEDPKKPLSPQYDHLRDVYLETWTDYAPPGRLRQLFEIGKTLGGLHQAVSYQQIIRSVEPAAGNEWSGALAYWLRYVLQRVQSPDDAKGAPDPGRPD